MQTYFTFIKRWIGIQYRIYAEDIILYFIPPQKQTWVSLLSLYFSILYLDKGQNADRIQFCGRVILGVFERFNIIIKQTVNVQCLEIVWTKIDSLWFHCLKFMLKLFTKKWIEISYFLPFSFSLFIHWNRKCVEMHVLCQVRICNIIKEKYAEI